MSEENLEPGVINITVHPTEDGQSKVELGTNMSMTETNFWIDVTKGLIVSGEITAAE